MSSLKKFSLITLPIFFIYAIFSLACATTNSTETPVFDVSYEYESENPAVSVFISPQIGYYWSEKGFSQFNCYFTNNTNSIIKIVWEGSGIHYGGNSYLLFVDGQKYIEASSNPLPASIIPRNGKLQKAVFSSQQPQFVTGQYGGWRMHPIESNYVEIMFQIDTPTNTEYITAKIRYHFESKNQ